MQKMFAALAKSLPCAGALSSRLWGPALGAAVRHLSTNGSLKSVLQAVIPEQQVIDLGMQQGCFSWATLNQPDMDI